MRGKEKGDHHRHRPEPEPSAPPVDQEYLLSATSLDPPEEEMAGLTTSDPVAPTYAIPSILDTNLDQLPVASAVPIVTDAVGASADTANSSAPNSSTGGKTTNKKTVSANKPSGAPSPLTLIENPRLHNRCVYANDGSLADPKPPRKEWLASHKPKSKARSAQRPIRHTEKLQEPQPPRKEWLEKQARKQRRFEF